jgi:predicted ATP-dependent endonuclease of OLD family
MNILEKVEIKGFWGDRSISIDFFKDVNFFIGVNGSGKTTVINIIAAALSADFSTLDRLPFSVVTLYLTETKGRRKPVIEVEKKESEKSPYSSIVYRIKEKASDKFVTYSLDEYEEEMLLRRGIPRNHQAFAKFRGRGIIAKLTEITNVSWLSIHRTTNIMQRKAEESFESSVDQKLDELSLQLAKYFSVLAAKVSEEIAEFQRSMIVSLLTEQTESTVLSSVKTLNLDEEKKALIDILTRLNIPKGAKAKLDKHYDEVSDARVKLEAGGPLRLGEIMPLISAYRSHRIVQDWSRLLDKQASIQYPRTIFLEVLNNLFERKKIDINQKNELEATTTSGKKMSIRGLSSGEKQLVIILGEALLQQSAPWIYIADEPELSLHVKWQEKLIESLRQLNPKAQIICATHSPDVVSYFSDKVFDMESKIK